MKYTNNNLFYKLRDKITVKVDEPLEALGLEHFVLPFAFLAGGLVLATLMFIMELYIYRKKQNNILQVEEYKGGVNDLDVQVAELEDELNVI